MSEESLKNQTVRGVVWSFADSMLGQGIAFLVGLVLARLLSPDEYGLIGIIMIFIAISNSIVDSGFSNALIRKNDAADKDYNTMFIVNLGVSIVLFLALFLASPLIALFFQREELTPLCRVMGVVVILNALSIVQNTILTKRLDFKTKAKISFISSVASGIIGIAMAYIGYGVWALAGQQISRQLLNTICLWFFIRWCPNFKFSINSYREMWNFGWKLLVGGMIDQTWTQMYQVVIGKCYTSVTLGLYTQAQQFANICSSNLINVVQRVSYPVLCKLQDDIACLKIGYKKIIKVTMLVSFTLMLGLAGCAKSFIGVLLGEKWMECVPFLQIICFNMMFYPINALNLNMLQVQGRSDLFLKLEIIKKSILVLPVLIGIFIGIYWMLISGVFIGLVCYYLNAYYSGPFLNYRIKEQVSDFMPSLVMSLIMFLILFGMSFINISYYILLPLQIITGGIFTILVCEIRKLDEYIEIKEILKPVLSKIKQRR